MYVCMYIYKCMYVCMYVFVCRPSRQHQRPQHMYVCIYINICMYVYICMYVCMYVCICVQAFSTASAPSATASTLAMLGSTDRELEEKVLVALGALVTDAGLFFVFFFFFFTANSRRRLLVALGALVKDADILNIALGEPKNGAVLRTENSRRRLLSHLGRWSRT